MMSERQLTAVRTNGARPDWSTKLMRRLRGLKPGRYQITLTVGDQPNWTVTELGKVEK